MRQYSIAVVGATGLVGETLLRVLDERRFPLRRLCAYAGGRDRGMRKVQACGCTADVDTLAEDSFKALGLGEIDLAFLCAGAEVSRRAVPVLLQSGALIIDKSEAFRLDAEVPLVVPEVNAAALSGRRLVASPNCAVIPLAVALAPIARRFGLAWVSVATYQSVSGAGRAALNEFERQLADPHAPAEALPRRIAGNVFPENGEFDDNGEGEEERKIAAELRKILELPKLRVSATSVRVPVAVGHAEAVAFGTLASATRDEIGALLRAAPGVTFSDGSGYATPLEVAGTDAVAVGRLREDRAHENAFLAWLVCDNLRKGAATNAVQIAEALLSRTAGVPA